VYAIIQTGGRQIRVEPGKMVTVDRFDGEPGSEAVFDKVLLVRRDGEILAGTPYVTGASVVAIVEGPTRGPKIRVFRKKRRKGMRRTKGHRSELTRVRVTDIRA
jgi:large subunit ribosomal protein L21